ncbi:MAG: hypothetical protein A3E82_02950 [Gammaproteobacteria bacterium RIFCSPHIGHO2_12_FULL_38_11]|nr:MAG: hypothetical protein A3E82_02950 [Gammaproteobacteria bacterium RIFCSPHIGHO2_12_FULL_38_11]
MRKRSRAKQSPEYTPSMSNLFRLPKGKKRIEVHSLDFDGCFGPAFKGFEKYKSMAEYNEEFVQYLFFKHKNSDNVELKFMVGSSRQSAVSDLRAMVQQDDKGENIFSGSCFVEIETFVSQIKEYFNESKVDVSLDRFLTTDIFHERAFDSTFLQAQRENGNYLFGIYRDEIQKLENIVPDLYRQASNICAYLYNYNKAHKILFDSGKFTLLLTQMHKIASENADADIDFHFYEDRDDILIPLYLIFNLHSELLPANLVFHPHLYITGKSCLHPYLAGPIKGNGVIDYEYKNTAIALRKIALDSTHPSHEKSAFVVDNLADRFIVAKKLEEGVTELISTPLLLEFIEARKQRLFLEAINYDTNHAC